MKVLMMYSYPPSPGGLATQGDLLFRGLRELGVDCQAVNYESAQEKEWYYRWFRPDVAVGVGYWGHTPDLVFHPQRSGVQPVPWLVADGFVADFHETLNALPLILVTSNWVKNVYVRDGLNEQRFEVLPVGCDTDSFEPRKADDPKVAAVREALGVKPGELMILTVGGDAASKGAREVMEALAIIDQDAPAWKYVCKVWPQPRTLKQNLLDLKLATRLGIENKVIYTTNVVSRNFMPYLIAACDIYAAPSHLEGFGMPQVEANACGKPVIGIRAMAMLDTLVHGETAFLAGVAQEIVLKETVVEDEDSEEAPRRIVFPTPRTVDYRPSVKDIAEYLLNLMKDASLRQNMGHAGRKRVVEEYDYRVVTRRFLRIIANRLEIS